MRPHPSNTDKNDKGVSAKSLTEAEKAKEWGEKNEGEYPDKWELSESVTRHTPGTVGDFLQDKEEGDFGSSSWLKGSIPEKPFLLRGNFSVSNIEAVSKPYTGAAVLLSPLDKLPSDAAPMAVWVYVKAEKQEVIDRRQELLNAGHDSWRISIAQSAPLAVMATTEEGKRIYFHALPTVGKGLAALLGTPARSGGFSSPQTAIETAPRPSRPSQDTPQEAPAPPRQEYDHPTIAAEPLNLIPGADSEKMISLLDLAQVEAATMETNKKALDEKAPRLIGGAFSGSLKVTRIDEEKTEDGARFFAKLESDQLGELELWSVVETSLNNSKQLREAIHSARSRDREGTFTMSRNAVLVPIQKEGNRIYVRDITGGWPLDTKTEPMVVLPGVEDKTSLISDPALWRAAQPKSGIKNAGPGEYFSDDFAIKITELEEKKPGRIMKGDLLDIRGQSQGQKLTIILADGLTNGVVGGSLRYSSIFRFQKVSDEPLVLIDRTRHD